MDIALGHFNFTPLIYGVIMFCGIAVMWFKLTSGRWFTLAIDVSVLSLVFNLNDTTMAGAVVAMIVALHVGLLLPLMVNE